MGRAHVASSSTAPRPTIVGTYTRVNPGTMTARSLLTNESGRGEVGTRIGAPSEHPDSLQRGVDLEGVGSGRPPAMGM